MTSIAAAESIDTVRAAEAVVAVASADQEARERIAAALATAPQLDVRVGASPHTLVSRDGDCDVLVLHCDSVASDELTLLADIKQQNAALLSVLVCDSANGRNARRAVDRGVDGLVFADQLDVAVAPTVLAVLAGQTVVPRELRASVRKASLSFREKQVLGMVVMGFTNSEIGARLFLTESTIKSHLSSAFSKLGVRSRNEAAAMILDPNGSLGTGILAITQADGDPRRPAAR